MARQDLQHGKGFALIEMFPSLWIWFYAIAETPEAALASRESLIAELHDTLVDERFTSFFEEERDDAERTYP